MDRMDKINALMKREISQIILQDMSDPRLTFVTITSVEVTRDLSLARVNFSVLGDDKHLAGVEQTLSGASGFIRRLVAERVRIRYIPEIEFVYDNSLEYGARIEQAIENLQQERQKRDPS